MSTKKLTLVGILIGVVVIALFVCGLTTQFKSSDPIERVMAERLSLNVNPEAYDTFYIPHKFGVVKEVTSPKFISYGAHNKKVLQNADVIKNSYSIDSIGDAGSSINIIEYTDYDTAEEIFNAFVYATQDKGSICEVNGGTEKCYYYDNGVDWVLVHYGNKVAAATISDADKELIYNTFPEFVVASINY